MARSMGPARSRNQNGRFRRKQRDTHVGTGEAAYARNLGGRSDKHLGTVLKEKKTTSLNDLVRG